MLLKHVVVANVMWLIYTRVQKQFNGKNQPLLYNCSFYEAKVQTFENDIFDKNVFMKHKQ